MGKQCRDVLDVIPETVVLAFDVAGWTEPRGTERIAKSKEVVDAINKELARQGQQLVARHFAGETIGEDQALKMLAAGGGKLLEDRKRELEQRVKCAYSESPLGVWLDRNKWVIYVVVPLVVGSAGTWMYVARVGDTPASWATSMANVKKDWKVQHLGKLTLGTEDVTFVPSRREISGKAFGMLDWERLSVRLTLGGGMAEDKFAGANVQADIKTAVTRDLELFARSGLGGIGTDLKGSSAVGLRYNGSGAGANLSLSLSGILAYQPQGVSSAGASASAGLKGRIGDVPASAGLTGDYKRNFQPGVPANEYSLTLKLSLGF